MSKQIQVVQSVLKANDAVASSIQSQLDANGVLGVNIMSAPGSGKTTLLQSTLRALGTAKTAVLVGDLQTTRDAERLSIDDAQVVQINTGRGCHLDATQVVGGLEHLQLNGLEYLFIENVGNMVCPASYLLGEHRRVALLSIPEGDDKVAKYPTLFQSVDAVLLTKTDLLGVLDFDPQRVKDDLAKLNGAVSYFELSTKTGEGLEAWHAWLRQERSSLKK